MTMREGGVLLCLLTVFATMATPASSQGDDAARLAGPEFSGVRPVLRATVPGLHAPAAVAPIRPLWVAEQSGTRRSPGWARFGGGFLTAAGAVIGIMAATYNADAESSDAVGGVLYAGGAAMGAMVGSAITTSMWEQPNRGLVVGALLGALPMVLAVTAENDDVVGWALFAGIVGAPLGASIGQAKGRD